MINTEAVGCDLLVVSPHTDDAEIGLGGTLHRLASRGRRVWVADLTRGELATNATPDERWAEAAVASEILGLAGRVQLELPDGFIAPDDRDQTGRLVALLRRLRPRWVVTAPDPVRHPDHVATPLLVRRAVFMARLQGWQPELGAHHLWAGGAALPAPAARWEVEARFAVCPDDSAPTLLFDISEHWEAKTRALAAYASQFGRDAGQTPTTINDPAFLARIERRARTWGRRAGVPLAEALCGGGATVLDDLPDARWGA
ncbi:bacillithiol biosynthesis deacetylase BshB1 [bacterium]|nr:bacillithiol biosynthesis deacetylase BshB1 [bacterium]